MHLILVTVLTVVSLPYGIAQGNSGQKGNPFAPTSKTEAAGLANKYAALDAQGTQGLFNEFKTQFGKTYADDTEEASRFGHFKAQLQQIIKTNSDPTSTFWAGVNQFSDMSFAEFSSAMLMPPRTGAASKPVHRRQLRESTRHLLQTIPKTVNWNTSGKVFPVQDQGGCGACWAFAATSTMESHALIDGKITMTAGNKMSEQQILDCTYSGDTCGSGGLGYDGLRYMYQNNLTTSAVYGTYTGSYQGCKANILQSTTSSQIVKPKTDPGFIRLPEWDANKFVSTIALDGPVDMAFMVIASFQSYAGGIYKDACRSSTTTPQANHEMTAIGYDITAGLGRSNSYILLKNSWGVGWGENGFARIQALKSGAGVCYSFFDNYIPS